MKTIMRRRVQWWHGEFPALCRVLYEKTRGSDQTHSAEIVHLECILAISLRKLGHGGWLITVEDLTAARKSEKKIEYLARHDTLTGLPNRFEFQERLKAYLESTAYISPPFALLYLDLDRFKAVNDLLGHHSGDQLLRLVAERLNAVSRKDAVLFRLGGDEFTILLPNCDLDEAVIVADRCIKAVTESFNLSGHEVSIGVSIGIVAQIEERFTVDEAMQHADSAMYKAKREGRNCYQVFKLD